MSRILREICKLETIFSDYKRACDDLCMECPKCERRKAAVAALLMRPNTLTWEVWRLEEGVPVDVVGILYLTDIAYGQDAVAHYVFFDHDLRSKTKLMKKVLDWVFEDHEGWKALQRLTLEVPEHAHALARHAIRYLGFGGQYTHQIGRKKLHVEGVKANAILWRGSPHPMLILGKLNGSEG